MNVYGSGHQRPSPGLQAQLPRARAPGDRPFAIDAISMCRQKEVGGEGSAALVVAQRADRARLGPRARRGLLRGGGPQPGCAGAATESKGAHERFRLPTESVRAAPS